MGLAIVPDSEAGRSAVVRSNNLDTPLDRALGRVIALAARMFDAPIAVLNVEDVDWRCFESGRGADVEPFPSGSGLCAWTIRHEERWLVEDGRVDPRTLTDPVVAGQLGLRFHLAVPLHTHDGLDLGTLCVVDCDPRQPNPGRMADLQDLAAVVIDELELHVAARRARLTERSIRSQAEELAGSLRESLLPSTLPAIPGLELATVYRPAHHERVGGDFYDAFPVQDGWGLAIGDVCGHGPFAAALAATARHALRAFAQDSQGPARSLARLNELMLQQGSDETERFCTVALARMEPTRAGLCVTVALGGHPRPLVVRRCGLVEAGGNPGTIVGRFAQPSFVDGSLLLSPGDTLVMYTDGITEARNGEAVFGDAALRSLLAGLGGRSADAVAAAVEEAVISPANDLRDDTTLLVAHLTG